MNKIIAVDFDGCLCENKYPEIGEPNQDLINYLKDRQIQGDKVILWTCRNKILLYDAILWCRRHGFIPDKVNENLPEKIKEFGGDTRKIFADEYIDDRNVTDISGVTIPFKPKDKKEKGYVRPAWMVKNNIPDYAEQLSVDDI